MYQNILAQFNLLIIYKNLKIIHIYILNYLLI